ncbi:MAG: Gfo/Idh/MocA family oxidoreductase [bacterium]
MKLKGKIHLPHRKTKKLKWGIAGCGKFTEDVLLPTLLQINKNKVISIFSNDITRAKYIATKFAAPNSFNNFTEFLKSDFDNLYIGSRNSDHYAQVIEAAKMHKNILCDKPLALNSAQALEMYETCKNNNVLFAVNYVNRFHPLVQKAKELIDKNFLGKIVSISTSYNTEFMPDENFRFKKELSGGGVLRDIGTHMIDLLLYFGGNISQIKGFMDNIIFKSEVEDFTSAIVKFENGGYGSFNVSFNTPKAFNRIEILGYKGCIAIDNIIGKRGTPAKLTIDLNGEGRKAFRNRASKQLFLLRSVCNSFLINETPAITGYDGYINMQVMELLEKQCL